MKKVFFTKYESVSSFLNALEKRPLNKMWSGAKKESEGTTRHHVEFTTTTCIESADYLFKYGDKSNYEKIKRVADKISVKGTGTRQKRRVKASMVGCVPHIGNYLAGDPNNMINIVKERISSSKVVNILYNPTVAWHVSANDIIEAGVKILSKIKAMESQGYRVNLYTLDICANRSRTEYVACAIRIKASDQYTDPMKLAYPLVNPSFTRRHGFKFIETESRITDRCFVSGYGAPITNEDQVRDMLKGQAIKVDFYYCVETALKIQL